VIRLNETHATHVCGKVEHPSHIQHMPWHSSHRCGDPGARTNSSSGVKLEKLTPSRSFQKQMMCHMSKKGPRKTEPSFLSQNFELSEGSDFVAITYRTLFSQLSATKKYSFVGRFVGP
jgi:hypothetical protein